LNGDTNIFAHPTSRLAHNTCLSTTNFSEIQVVK